MLLALLLPLAQADTPLFVARLDPAVTYVPATDGWGGELTLAVEAPVAFFVLFTVPAMVGVLTGKVAVEDVPLVSPPMSPQYIGFVRRGFGAEDPVEGGGGLGLRLRPFAPVAGVVPALGGLWFEVDGRYGTAGWGVDAAVGREVLLGGTVVLGPAVGVVAEGGETRVVARLSVGWALTGEWLDGEGR